MGFGKMPSLLKKRLLIEYLGGMVACLILLSIAFAVYRRFRERATSGVDGERIDRLWKIVASVIAIVVFVGYPVWVFIASGSEIGELQPTAWKIIVNSMIAAPAVVVAAIVFLGRQIDGWMTRRQYRDRVESVPAEKRTFRTAADFCEELQSRGLFFEEKDRPLLARFGGSEATLMPLEKKEFRDCPDDNEVLSPDSTVPHPAYVYNAVLVKVGADEVLRYAPFSRYVVRGESETDPADDNEFYIECKILYLERFLYAVIGVGESRAVGKHFSNGRKPYYTVLMDETLMDHYHCPGPLTVHTYIDGRFYPFGMIRDTGTGFEMLPDDRVPAGDRERSLYKVVAVPHLDREKIDDFAEKLEKEYFL